MPSIAEIIPIPSLVGRHNHSAKSTKSLQKPNNSHTPKLRQNRPPKRRLQEDAEGFLPGERKFLDFVSSKHKQKLGKAREMVNLRKKKRRRTRLLVLSAPPGESQIVNFYNASPNNGIILEDNKLDPQNPEINKENDVEAEHQHDHNIAGNAGSITIKGRISSHDGTQTMRAVGLPTVLVELSAPVVDLNGWITAGIITLYGDRFSPPTKPIPALMSFKGLNTMEMMLGNKGVIPRRYTKIHVIGRLQKLRRIRRNIDINQLKLQLATDSCICRNIKFEEADQTTPDKHTSRRAHAELLMQFTRSALKEQQQQEKKQNNTKAEAFEA
mmetsp:Transcript_705/g.1252  ORF Transcript_705/g.1252 Transcript_705/m.1252 type:complete len:327 (+) Transcript_705:142-1122(+)|eukprot:CAMPEP_0197528582 /NCGR_PEP_ID=MMETSP1318-20131121/25614_1 /TAXON_ID=552666 /ORGANISM="Partenskyella glossopodia, Strain RCC365" /LENGTH=326 /DNA_ID=CAMNT_0043083737 /DNA_START=119 /DNA_END=1099 /DNA_ORIENTATION=+